MNWMNVFVEYIQIETKNAKFEIEIEQTVQGIFRKRPIRTVGILWKNLNGSLHPLYRYVDHGHRCHDVYENVVSKLVSKFIGRFPISFCGVSKTESFSLLSKSEINTINIRQHIPML